MTAVDAMDVFHSTTLEEWTMTRCFITLGLKASCLLLIGVSLALTGCDSDDESMQTEAMAEIAPTSGNSVTGEAVFTQNGADITVTIEIENASPGEHGVHIHATGDCSAPDGTSAGGHWNPTDVAHGKWGDAEFHLGDLGNIAVGADGTGSFELTTDLWDMDTGSDLDVVGKAIIVHAGADDFVSQPSGAAGARIGCGVIELME